MKVLILGCCLLALAAAYEEGKEYEYFTELRSGAGTFDHAPHISGVVAKYTTTLQYESLSKINGKISGAQFSEYVGAWDKNAPTSALNFSPYSEMDGVEFTIQLENGQFKSLSMPSGMHLQEKNFLKAWVANFQMDVGSIQAGKLDFKSQEQTIHGTCEVSYTVASDSVYKSFSPEKDCPNRVFRKIDNLRGWDCEYDDKDKADGLVSRSNIIYATAANGDKRKLTGFTHNGVFISHMFGMEGLSLIAMSNATTTLVAERGIGGAFGGGGEMTNTLQYEFADGDYTWNQGRDLKAAEPLFSTGAYHTSDQGKLKANFMAMVNKQGDLLHANDNSKDTVAAAHMYAANSMLLPLYGMDYATLESIHDQLRSDSSEDGVLKANVFTELLGSTGTTAAAMLIKDLLEKGKYENARDASRTLSSVPYHIRRPNEQLVDEFAKLLDKDDESLTEMAIPLSFGHLVRMTCERAGSYDVMKKCFMSLGKKWVDHFFQKYQSAESREMKNLYLAVLNNLRYGGQSTVLQPVISGATKDDSEFRSMAIWIAMHENAVLGTLKSNYFPVYAETSNDHEVRNAAVMAILASKPTTTDVAKIVAVLKNEKDYELINAVFAKLETMASSINPCDRKSKEIASFFLKYLKQFSQYNTNWGFGVSKSYERQFVQRKYGYSGSYKFYTVGAHDSTTPLSIGMGITTTLHNSYRSYGFFVHLRIQGLAKGLIRKFKTMDPAVWKTAALAQILKDDMNIQERPDQPVRVAVMIMIKGNVFVVRSYDFNDSGEGGKLEEFMEKLQGLGSAINHQRAINLAFFLQEQPSASGFPNVFGTTATLLASIKAKAERKQSRGLIYADVSYDIHLYTQAKKFMMVQLPKSGNSYGIIQDRVYHAHVPREITAGVDPIRKEVKLKISRPEIEHPAMFLMHAQTSVNMFNKFFDGQAQESLKKHCSFCKPQTTVSVGEDAATNRKIFSKESEKWGYKTHAEYFDCEMDNRRSRTFGRGLAAFMPYNKNPKTPWTSIMMGIRQIRAFLFYYPRAEKCGIFATWSQSKSNPVTSIEMTVRVKKESLNDDRLFLRGRKLLIKANVKANGANPRSYRMNIATESSAGGLNSKTKVQIDRAPVSALGIKPYVICLNHKADYPPFSQEMFDVDMTQNLKASGKAQLKYGAVSSCDAAEGVVNLNFEYSTTSESRESLKNQWYYKKCMEQKMSDAWQLRNGLPVSEECYLTAYDASNARKYKYNVKFEKMTDRMKKLISTAKTVVKAATLPYMTGAEDIDVDVVGDYMNMEATLHSGDKMADVTIETVSGTKKIVDYPMRLDWSSRLRNLKFTKTYERVKKMGLVQQCVATKDSIQTMDNVTYSYTVPSCWTLMSGHCAENPSYAVFVKTNGGKLPVAMKAFIGGHMVDIEADSGEVRVNGAPIEVSTGNEYKAPGDTFKVSQWGTTFNIYSFLRVWIVFDGNFAMVVPAPSVKGAHCGLCGNYNRNKFDEMTGKDGKTIHSSVDAMIADYKWKC